MKPIELPDYEALFCQYVVRSVRAMGRQLQANNNVPLSEQAVQDAWHVLDFGLRLADAWPYTCALLLNLASNLEQAGYRDDWLGYLEDGIMASQQYGDARAEAELRLHAGHLDYLCSRFAKAEASLNHSLTLFQTCGDARSQARTYNELAWLNHLQHRYAEATQQVEQALALLPPDDPERAMSYRVQGMIAIDERRWTQAEEFHRQALLSFEKQGDRRRLAWSIQNLAYSLRGQSRHIEAITYYQHAIAILKDIQDPVHCAIAQMNLGIIYWMDGQSTKALEMYNLAEQTFIKCQDIYNLAKVFNNKGLQYMHLRDWPQAEKSFLHSAALHEKIGDINLRLNALDGLGLVYLGQGQSDKALATFTLILTALPLINGTPTYNYLTKVLPGQLEQAKQG